MTGTVLTLLNAPDLAAYTEAGYWGGETLYAIAARHARATPDAFAVRDRHRRLTYRALGEAADRLAAHPARNGIRPGQPVPLWVPGPVQPAVEPPPARGNPYPRGPPRHPGPP